MMFRFFMLLILTVPSCAPRQSPLQDGDIIFQKSLSENSTVVQLATWSPFSHMGFILIRDGKPVVVEAVDPVQETPIQKWIDSGDGHHYVIKRLKNADNLLTPGILQRLRDTAQKMEGLRYDEYYQWSDKAMYCSELVWKVYERVLGIKIGELKKFRDLNIKEPAVMNKIHSLYGTDVPWDEPIIFPGSMFNSPELVVVDEG